MYKNERCETCLSLGRKMCHIDEDQLQSICPGFQLSLTKSRICWECSSMVNKWIKFRDRVVKAQETLADYNTHNYTSLSTLSIKRNYPISIDSTTYSDDLTHLEVKDGLLYKDELLCKDWEEILDNYVTDFEDPIAENKSGEHPVKPTKNNLTPIRVYTKQSNTQTKLISRNPVKSCIKKTNNESKNTEKKVGFIKDGSETETADEFEDEVMNKEIYNGLNKEIKEKETAKTVRVEKNKLLKVMGRVRRKPWFHLSKKPKCEMCIVIFKNEDSLRLHMKKHKESSGAHTCEVCQQRFTTIEKVKIHEEAHLNTCIECTDCHELFISAMDFSVHYKRRHSKWDIICHKCIKMFRTLPEYRKHRREVHLQMSTCDKCGKKVTKYHIKAHIKSCQSEESHECPICFKVVKGDMEILLKRHIRNTHTPTVADEDNFCVECNKQFKTNALYRGHVKQKHENVKSKCPKCGKFYPSLRAHMITHSDVFKYSCPECNKKYKWRSALNSHLKYHHQGVPKSKTKTCNICQKSFHSNKILREHMNIHTGERPYVCKTCGDTFGFSAALFTHNRLKHQKKNVKKVVG